VLASLIAVAALLILFVPGYLFQAGVREYHSVLAAERDLFAIAQAVGISAGGLVLLMLVLRILGSLGLHGAESLQDALLHDPSGGDEWSLTTAQEALLIFLLVFPVGVGRRVGRWMTWRDKRRRRKERHGGKACNRGFFPDSPVQMHIHELAKVAHREDVYVRIVRQGEEDVIGLLDRAAAEATQSPLGQGLALSICWVPNGCGGWQRLPGVHLGTAGIVKIIRWSVGTKGPPIWLSGIPGVP
jgi:hypothetical protein